MSTPPATRIVHVTTVHRRDDIRIFRKICISLARAGYDVILVVGDGAGDAIADGVRIVDLGAAPAGRLGRMWRQPIRALRLIRSLSPALVHFHDPELLPLGSLLAAAGVPVIYDVHEDVPRQLETKGWIPDTFKPLAAYAFEFLENTLARNLSVIAATPHIAARFTGKARHSLAVPNYPSGKELAPPDTSTQRSRTVCYVGGLSRPRGILNMVRALPLVPGLNLVLCGAFEDERFASELRREPGWTQVTHLGWVDRQTIRTVMARCFAGLVTLLPQPAYREALPIKMFEYMSAGIPVIASDFPRWRGILDRTGAGVCVDPENPAAIAGALQTLLDDPARSAAMGKAGREAVAKTYHWERAEAVLLELYGELTAVHAAKT